MTDIDLATGAWTGDHFIEQLIIAGQQARRAQQPLWVLVADVDRVTELNDVWGEEHVDQLLNSIAEEMSFVLDGRGPIGRIDAGRFATFVVNLVPADAVQLAESIRARSRRTLPNGPPFTLSVGIAPRRPVQGVLDAFESAQRACLKAKYGGGDAVVAQQP